VPAPCRGRCRDNMPVGKTKVAHRNHVGLLKMNVDIRIRMRGSNVLESEDFAIGSQLVTGSGRSAAARPSAGEGVEMQAGERAGLLLYTRPADSCGLGHALLSVFVGQDCGSRGVKMRVVIGMVEMPVGVDDVFKPERWPRPSRALLSLGQAGATKVFYDEFCRREPLRTTTAPPGPSNIVRLSASFLHLHGNGIKHWAAGNFASRSAGGRRLLCDSRCGRRGATPRGKRWARKRRCRPAWPNLATFGGVRFASVRN